MCVCVRVFVYVCVCVRVFVYVCVFVFFVCPEQQNWIGNNDNWVELYM